MVKSQVSPRSEVSRAVQVTFEAVFAAKVDPDNASHVIDAMSGSSAVGSKLTAAPATLVAAGFWSSGQ